MSGLADVAGLLAAIGRAVARPSSSQPGQQPCFPAAPHPDGGCVPPPPAPQKGCFPRPAP
jgi:hypothetical protein